MYYKFTFPPGRMYFVPTNTDLYTFCKKLFIIVVYKNVLIEFVYREKNVYFIQHLLSDIA